MLTDAEIDQVIDEDFLGYHQMTPMDVGKPAPAEYYERFDGRLPRPILRAWERFGFDGFSNGKLWLTDPIEYAPAIDAWLDGLDLPFNDTWHCLTQSALGRLALWGEKTGTSLTITLIDGVVWPNRSAAERNRNREFLVRNSLRIFDTPEIDLEKDSVGKPIVEALIALHGPLNYGEIYAISARSIVEQINEPSAFSIHNSVPFLTAAAHSIPRRIGEDFVWENRHSLDTFLAQRAPE